jgi:hypothetical protein
MLRLPKQENNNKLSQFIGIVNYYRDMWFRRSELLARFRWLASHEARSSLSGTHSINSPFIKLRKLFELRSSVLLCFSAIQISISPFIFTLMHQIIRWGQSSCRIKSLQPFIRESSIQLKSGIQPLRKTDNCYQLLKQLILQGIQEYPVRLPSTHHSLYRT